MTETSTEFARVGELIGKARFAFVTTSAPDGRLLSRPLAVLERDFDGDLYFFTMEPSAKTDQVTADSQVNVSMQCGDDYLSIAGTATVSRDQAMIDELWNAYAEAWFEQGRDDLAVALLKVHADSAEYWAMDSPKPINLIKYAKAILTGEQPDVATNTSVDL